MNYKIIVFLLVSYYLCLYADDVIVVDKELYLGTFVSDRFVQQLKDTHSFKDAVFNRGGLQYHDVITIKSNRVSCVAKNFDDQYAAAIESFTLFKAPEYYYLKDEYGNTYRKISDEYWYKDIADIILEETGLSQLYINEHCFMKDNKLYVDGNEYFFDFRIENTDDEIDFVFGERSRLSSIGIQNNEDVTAIYLLKVKYSTDEDNIDMYAGADYLPWLIIDTQLYELEK